MENIPPGLHCTSGAVKTVLHAPNHCHTGPFPKIFGYIDCHRTLTPHRHPPYLTKCLLALLKKLAERLTPTLLEWRLSTNHKPFTKISVASYCSLLGVCFHFGISEVSLCVVPLFKQHERTKMLLRVFSFLDGTGIKYFGWTSFAIMTQMWMQHKNKPNRSIVGW